MVPVYHGPGGDTRAAWAPDRRGSARFRAKSSAVLRSVRAPLAGVLASLALVLLAPACGGAARSFDGEVYRAGPVAFRIGPVPSSWRAIDVTDAALAYRDDAHRASILVNARCKKPDDVTPLVALTNHLVMGSTERDVTVQETEPFDGREALRTRLRAKWDGVTMAHEIFVLKRDGCVYDFVYTGAPEAFEAGVSAFEGYVRSFRALPGSGVVGGGAS